MNCAQVRQRLLLSERPDKPRSAEARHLADCSACQNWLRRLVRLERQITELTVPACPAPAALLEQILRGDSVPALVRSPIQPSKQVPGVREKGRQKLALACSLAATLALFSLAWWAWPPRSTNPTSNQPAWRARIEQRLQQAATPRDRLVALTGLVEELLADVQEHVDNPRYVANLAEEFDRLVQSDLVDAALQLPVADRPAVLGEVLRDISRSESTAAKLAFEWRTQHPESAKSLEQIARSAREAERRLRRIAQSSA